MMLFGQLFYIVVAACGDVQHRWLAIFLPAEPVTISVDSHVRKRLLKQQHILETWDNGRGPGAPMSVRYTRNSWGTRRSDPRIYAD